MNDPAAGGPAYYRPLSRDLIDGGPDQCPHGVTRGAWVRPGHGTPGCAICRRIYLEQRKDA